MEKNRPEKKFRAGGISVTVWSNRGKGQLGESVSYKTVNFERRYKNPAGEWQSATSLRVNDIPKAVLALHWAYEYLMAESKGSSVSQEEGG